jgi:outer membrane protein OmpA-like peptidoglycan-associated protein
VKLSLPLVTLALAACATARGPSVTRSASVAESIRVARQTGADRVPLGSLHLGLAADELASARRLAAEGEYARADALLARAQADAELAAALGREASATTAPPRAEGEDVEAPSERRAKATVSPLAEVEEAAGATVITVSESVLFRLGSAELLPTAAGTLDELADAALGAAGAEVSVRAFDRTSALARARAASIERALAARGVVKLRVEGFGGDVDRRVEITLRGAPRP